MTDPLFYVDRLATGPVTLTGSEAHHAVSARRLRPGEAVDLSDGRGRLGHGVVTRTGRDELVVEVGDVVETPPPQPRIVVAQALPKGERAELAVEALTEVGVDEIVPWQAARCVVRWEADRRARGVARWRATAREAGKQSRRPWLPEVAEPATTAALVQRARSAELAVVLHEGGTVPIAELEPPAVGEVLLVVGPEGGVSPEELDAFGGAGALVVRLGPSVLRTSTAGAVGAAVLLSRSPRWRAANTI